MPDVLRVKRRAAGGAAGPPTVLAAAEIAFNEQDNVLYYGKGNNAGAATSIIPIAGPGGFLPIGGGGLTNGLNFGSVYDASAGSVARHISLYGGNAYGFGVTANRLNYLTTGAHVFAVGGVDVTTINATGIVLGAATAITLVADPTAALQAATKQYVDARDAAGVVSFNTRTGAVSLFLADVTGVGGAPLASPVFTGAPFLPAGTTGFTQAEGNNGTALATTAFVTAALTGNYLPLTGGTVSGTTTFGPAGVVVSGSTGNVGLAVTASTTIGINLSGGTFSGPAIRLTNLQAISFTNTSVRNLYFDNATTPAGLKYSTGTVAAPNDVITLGDNGTIYALGGLNADNAAGTSRGLGMFTDGLVRWTLRANGTAEGGANAGSDLDIVSFSDAGTALVNPLMRITRSTGLAQFFRGIAFPGTAPGGITDLSRHIALFGTTYGLSVTSARVNYVVPTGATHAFVVAGADIATINAAGMAMASAKDITLARNPTVALHAVTKQYVDAISGLLNVRINGAVGNGVADDTAAIQATINAALAAGSGVYLPPGTYKTSAPLTLTATTGFKFCGDGEQVSIIAPSSLTTDAFIFTSPNGVCPIEVCDFSVLYNGTATNGTVFNFGGGCGGMNFHDIMIINGFNGMLLGGGTMAQSFTIDNVTMMGFRNNGLTIDLGSPGVGGLGYISRIFMNTNPTANEVGTGIYITGGQSLTFDMMQIQGMRSPIVIQAANGTFITDLTFTNCYGDGAAREAEGNSAWTISSGLGLTRRLFLTNCWGGATGGDGFALDSVDEISLVNCIAIANHGNGFGLQANCTNIIIEGCQAIYNSLDAPGTYSGISVTGVSANISIIGCRCGTSSDFPTPTQAYGIIIGSGTTNEYIISLNRLNGNITAGLLDAGTGAEKFVANNLSI